MNSIEEIAEILIKLDNYTIVGHSIPDGDCIGSVLGLYLGLKAINKQAIMVLADPVPSRYHYLSSWDKILNPSELQSSSANIIFLDCADMERVGDDLLKLIKEPSCIINIDHHLQIENYGDFNYVNPRAAATGEIVYKILQAMPVKISKEIADCLYAAIIKDTGRFLNNNTTSDTMNIAGDLLQLGADVNKARNNLYESKSQLEMLLLRQAFQNLGFSEDGRIAWMSLSYDEVKDLNALDFHPEDIINYTRMIEGVEVGLLFREILPGVIKIGFRSKGDIDVASIAAGYSGGGHRQAAGAQQKGSLEDVKFRVINKVKDVIS